MYKGLYDVRLKVEDREEELLFLSESYEDASKFYCNKVDELRKDSSLEFAFEHEHYYLGDFIRGTSFTDEDFLEHDVRISNDMFYDNGYLYHPDGTAEEMTEEDFLKTLENYRKVV